MKIYKDKLQSIFFLLFLILVTQSNVVIQFVSIIVFGIINFLFYGYKVRYIYRWFFYVSLILLSFIQLFFIFSKDYSINYVINTLLSTIFLVFAFLSSEFVIQKVNILSEENIKKILVNFFIINTMIIIIQYILMVVKSKSIIPYSTSLYGMGAGDYIKGIFSNSSINMIINSFYLIYFLFEKKKIFILVSSIIILLTTYMSGITLFLSIISLFVFFAFSLKNKIKIIAIFIFSFYLFYLMSPENVNYVVQILTTKLDSKTDPARKIVSFKQTIKSSVENPKNFIFGLGGGKYSSRAAFVTGGEYVNWYPEKYTYKSEEFSHNHFLLWNKKILSIRFKDGTSNQPFSFYNKMLGEYGVIGLFLFLSYLYYPFKYYKRLRYGKIILLSMLLYFILDYWFEYFSVIIFFEIFMYLDLKNEKSNR